MHTKLNWYHHMRTSGGWRFDWSSVSVQRSSVGRGVVGGVVSHDVSGVVIIFAVTVPREIDIVYSQLAYIAS